MIYAIVFIVLSIFISIFQIALALGAPLGEFTMGGKFPGKLPTKMRVAAIIQVFILLGFNLIVISKSGLALSNIYSISKFLIWVILAFFVLGSILNLSSPSRKERYVMGPLNLIALLSVLMIALLNT